MFHVNAKQDGIRTITRTTLRPDQDRVSSDKSSLFNRASGLFTINNRHLKPDKGRVREKGRMYSLPTRCLLMVNPVRIVGNPFELQTGYFPNTKGILTGYSEIYMQFHLLNI